MLRRLCFATLFWTAALQPALAAEKPVLEAFTEMPGKHEVRPSRALVHAVLRAIDKDDVGELGNCLSEKKLKRHDYAALLRAVRIDAGGGRALWFVRPALEPYCQALYGAHLFQYFLFEEQPPSAAPRYRLLFQNGGDGFAVYAKQSHGLNDIEATGCIVDECRSARMSFDGSRYRTVKCTCSPIGGPPKKRRCGSDGMDDQSSGFASPCGG